MIASAMLSTETVARLDQLCDDSHDVFSEGGVIYSFYDSARPAKSQISIALARLCDLDHLAVEYGTEPSGYSNMGYACAQVVLDAIGRAAATSPGDPAALREAVRAASSIPATAGCGPVSPMAATPATAHGERWEARRRPAGPWPSR